VGFVDWSVESLAAAVPLPSVGPADAVARPGPASESPRTIAAALTRAALFAGYTLAAVIAIPDVGNRAIREVMVSLPVAVFDEE
jgi:hypothetical protein